MTEADHPAAAASARGRPLPVPDATSAGFWAAAGKHVLTLARCSNCKKMTLPPDIICPNCHCTDPRFTFEPVEGRGRIRTWIIVRRSFLQGFELPMVLVDVELANHPQVRIVARLLDGPDAPLRLGAPVKVAFEDLTPDIAVPAFRLEQAA